MKDLPSFTDQLGRLYPSSEGARLLVTFDSFVEPDRAAQLAEDVADAGAGIRSINEIRSDRGYQMPDAEWGELPIQPSSNRPFNGEEPPQPAMSSGMDYRGERQDSPPWDSLETVKKRFSPAAEFRTARRRELVWASPVEKTVRSLWAGEKTQIMKNFNALPFEVWPYEDSTGERASSDDLPNAAEAERVASMIATPTLEDAERYQKKLGKLFTRIYETSAEETTEFLASAKPFSMTTKASEAIELETSSLYRYDSESTRKAIVKSLSQSITEGKGSKAAATQLRKSLDIRMDQASAQRIAATEISSVTNAARLDSFAQSESVEGTRWMNSMDAAVRPSHLIEGQFAPLGGKFTLGSGEQARYPGDPSLSGSERINCRCAAIPTFKQNLDDNWAAKSEQAASEVDGNAAIGFAKASSKMIPAEN